jgi:hypothetical protein
MNTYAIVSNGVVVNIIVWDGDNSNWQPPSGSQAIPVPADIQMGMGSTYSDGVFSAAPAPIF